MQQEALDEKSASDYDPLQIFRANLKEPIIEPTPIMKACKHHKRTDKENMDPAQAVKCTACQPHKKGPMIQCSIENETKQVIIDTGATITVFKRTRNLPESKLRLKSATSHKAALYGPEWTDIKVGKQVYRFPVYEADISENLLGYDFLDTFEGVVNTKTQQLELEGDVKIPYKVVHSVHKGDFASGKVSYAIRANQKILLKPFVER